MVSCKILPVGSLQASLHLEEDTLLHCPLHGGQESRLLQIQTGSEAEADNFPRLHLLHGGQESHLQMQIGLEPEPKVDNFPRHLRLQGNQGGGPHLPQTQDLEAEELHHRLHVDQEKAPLAETKGGDELHPIPHHEDQELTSLVMSRPVKCPRLWTES